MLTDHASSDHTLGDALDDAETDHGYDGANDNTSGHNAKRERIPLQWRSPLASLTFARHCRRCANLINRQLRRILYCTDKISYQNRTDKKILRQYYSSYVYGSPTKATSNPPHMATEKGVLLRTPMVAEVSKQWLKGYQSHLNLAPNPTWLANLRVPDDVLGARDLESVLAQERDEDCDADDEADGMPE